MPSSGLKKKKRKAAKKKKKTNKTKNNNNKAGITIHSSTTSQGDEELENGYAQNVLNKEGSSISSVGLVSKLKSMEGSSNHETESKTGVVGGVAESESEVDTVSRSVSIERGSSSSSEDDRSSSEDEAERVSSTSQLVGNDEEVVKPKEQDGQDGEDGEGGQGISSVEKVVASDDAEASTRDLIEKAVSDSEVEDISIVKTESLDVEDLPSKEIKDELVQSENAEAIVIEKTKDLDTAESVPKDEGRMVSSLDALYVGTEESKDRQSIESSHDEEANVPIVPRQIVKRTSCWSCCGLFDVVTGDHR